MNSEIYHKIYNHYLSCLYLNIYLLIKNKEEVVSILYKTIKYILFYELPLNIDKLNLKANRYLYSLVSEYVKCNQKLIDMIDISELDLLIPNEIYMLSANIYKYFNETDNNILSNYLINKKPIKEIMQLLNCDERYIKDRLCKIFIYAKNYFDQLEHII